MAKRYVIMLRQVCDYAEKAPFVASGKSIEGALEYRRERDELRCHECGDWFSALGLHVSKKHKLDAKDYKSAHGLRQKTGLVAPIMQAAQRDRARRSNAKLLASGKMVEKMASMHAHNSNHRSDLERRPRREKSFYEARNFNGKCQAQLIAHVKRIAEDLGKTPSEADLNAAGISRGEIYTAGFAGFRKLQIAAGLEPNKYGKELQVYSKAILLELLRDFWALNHRLPRSDDMKSGLLPANSTFISYFGSFAEACEEAGLGYRLTREGGIRGKNVKVLTPQIPSSGDAVEQATG